MKFLSATAVFAAALPSVTEASTSESPITITDLSSNRTGTGSFSSQFTEIIPEGGAEYKISGNVSFSSFSNISEEIQEPSSDPEQEENDDNDEESSLESPNTVTEENSSPETPGDNSQTSSPQEAERGPEESSSSTTTSSPSTPSEQTQNNAIALRSFLYSLQAETEETGQTSQEGVSNGETTHPESTEEDQPGSTEEGQQKPSVNNTTSGGGAFYNNHTGPLSFVNNPENPGSLTLSKIRVTGEGGAIYSKGPLSIKDLKQLVLEENLSKKAGGAILGESTVTISGVDTLTFSKNAVEVTFVDQSETQNPSNGSEAEGSSGSSNDSDHSSSGGGSNGDPSTAQAVAFSRFLSASPSPAPKPEVTENTDSSVKIELGCGGGIYSKGKLTVSNSKEIFFKENSATKDGGGIYSEEDISVSTVEKVLFTGNTAGVVGKESATDKEQTPTDPEQGSPESAPNSVSPQPGSTASARLTQLSLTRSASTEGGESNGQENSPQQDEQASENTQQGQDSPNENQDPDQSDSENDQSSDSESPSQTPPQSPTTEVIKPVVGRGGAVYTEKSLTVTDVTQIELVNNSATGAGGAIYAADKVAFTTTASNTSDARDPGETTISDNKASGCGGGVCTKAFSAGNLKTLTLSKNISKESGGAIYTDLDALKTPENSETEQPTPPSSSSSEGPAAAAKTSRFVATTSTPKSETVVASPASDIDVFINKVLNVAITENKAAKKGGGVYGKKAKFSNLDKLDISNNTAQDIGGGLCLTESVEFDAIGSLSTSNNSAIAQGAGIHAKTVTITNTKSAFTFANNTVQATEDPEPEVTQPEENVPSEEENPSSTPNNGQNQNTSPANRQNQEQSGVEESGSEEASDVNSEQKVESAGVSDSNGSNQQESPVISPSEDNDQAEGSGSTSSSEKNDGNSDSGDQNLSEESQEKSPTEETQNSTSENNAESNNSSNTDSTASTGSTEENQNSQTDNQENSDVNSGQEVESEGVSDSNGSNQQESQVISPGEDSDQAEGSGSTSSSEKNNGNSDSGDQNLSEESQEKSPTEETQNSTSENNAESNNSSNTDSTASTGSTEENQNSQTDNQENSDVNSGQEVESEEVLDSNGSNQQESQVISPSEDSDQAEGSGSTSSSENGQNQEQSGVEESGSEEASDVNSEQKVESEEVSDSNGSNQQESQVISPGEDSDQAEGSGSTSSSENGQNQEQSGVEESGSEEASDVNSGQKVENEGVSDSNGSNQQESPVISPSEDNDQAEGSDSTSSSEKNNGNSDSGDQNLSEESQEKSPTESENNAESNNNSSNTDSTASTGSTEGNQNSQTDNQENRDSNENESVSSSDGSEEQHTESENTNSHVPSQSDLSETNSETSEANTSEHAQNGEQTSENADSSTKENELSEVENTESSSAVSSESPTNSQEPQTTASSRVAILSSTDTVVSSSAAPSTSEDSGSDASGEESESEAASPDENQTEGSSDSPTLVAGGAIWGDTVKIENFSGNGTFSNNKVIDNKNSASKADVLGGAIYAKTSLDINNESSNRSIIFSDNSVSSKSTVGQVAGGAIFSPTVTIKAPVVFSKNSATHEGTSPKNGGTTLKDTFGGAIGATTSVSISKGASFSENIADIGSAIGLVADAIPVDNNSGTATVSDPGTPSTTPDTQNKDKDTVRLEGGSYYFEKNKALKRATIYAPTVSIKAYTATFNQNSSAEEGSAIYFTKEASIESLGSVLFTGNLVTPTKSTTVISTENVKKYGAAIFGQIADTNGTQPTSQTTTDNLPLTLIASGGNISFRNNEYRPTAPDIGQSTFCSIGGDVKLSMQAAEGKTISFFDAIQTTTKKTGTQASAYDTLDINKSNDAKDVNSAFTGTIMFSSELHENKSYIPQNVVLHSGSLVLKANTELHVISFEQKEGSSLIMEPGAVLSNQAIADGSLVINSLTIDLSSVGTTVSSGGGLFTPPELRIVDTNTAGGGNSGAQPGGSGGAPTGGSNGGAESNPGNGSSSSSPDANNTGSGSSSTNTDQSNVSGGNGASSSADSGSSTPSSSSPLPTAASAQASITKNLTAATPAAPTAPAAPGTTGNQVILDGVITLVDPNGTFFQNPALGSNQTISLLVLPTDSSKMQAQKVVLTGDVSPVKGYTGTLTLDLSNLQNGIQANWTFNSYRQWAYIPRDNHFYANSIIGSQMSMATVKQGLINDKLNLARFDEVAYNNLWVSGVGTMLSQRGGPRSEEMTYYSRGASVALDAKPAQDLIIGAAFSKMIGRSKSLKQEHNYTHKGSEYSYQASVYGGRPFHLVMNRGTERTLPLLLQGVISYGYIKHDTVTHYPTIRERNKGEWEDLGWLAALRLSSILKAPKQGDSKRISVFGEFEYSSIRQKQFTETEYDPRYFGNCTYRNLAIPLGIALEGEFKGNDILMYNRFSVAYMPSIYRNSPVCKYKVLSSGEGGEIICGVPTRNTSRAEYSTQLYLGPLWTLYGSYTLEADAHTLANMINCGARMTF